jgi:hypothetical protein
MRKITIPTKLNEITLGQFILLQESVKEDNEFHTSMAMIRILCGMTTGEILAMSSKDFDDIIYTLSATLKQTPIHEPIFGNYGFIPNFDKITTGELIDIETFLKDENIVGAVGVMYRPIEKRFGKLYTINPYDVDKVIEEDILALPCTAYLGTISFFLTLLDELLIYIPNFMSKIQMTKSQRETLEKNGAGIVQLTQSLEEICDNTRQSLQSMFTPFYII